MCEYCVCVRVDDILGLCCLTVAFSYFPISRGIRLIGLYRSSGMCCATRENKKERTSAWTLSLQPGRDNVPNAFSVTPKYYIAERLISSPSFGATDRSCVLAVTKQCDGYANDNAAFPIDVGCLAGNWKKIAGLRNRFFNRV